MPGLGTWRRPAPRGWIAGPKAILCTRLSVGTLRAAPWVKQPRHDQELHLVLLHLVHGRGVVLGVHAQHDRPDDVLVRVRVHGNVLGRAKDVRLERQTLERLAGGGHRRAGSPTRGGMQV